MTSRRSSGSMRTESVVEPTTSANITVTWRRSAVSWVFGSVTATGIEEGASGAAVRAAIAFSSFLRWPSDATPMSLRSPFVSRPSSSPSMSLARKISAYWARPIPRSQPSMSKFSPHLGSCQRQSSKKVESLAPTVIPRGFLNQLGFAMWTPTTRQKHSRTVTRYQTDFDRHRVARHRSALAEALRDGPAARVADARDRQWDILRDAGGLPVAAGAERPAAVGDDLPLVRGLARRRAL